MTVLSIQQPQPRVSNLLVVCLPAEGLISGFKAGEWTVVERFAEMGDAKLRLRRLLGLLDHLKARAFIVQETDPRQTNKFVSWRTVVRYREPDLYLDPSDATELSEEAADSWASAEKTFQNPPAPPAKSSLPSRSTLVAAASAAAAMVAVVGMVAAIQASRVEVKFDPLQEFVRQGGTVMTLPDERRPGWYVRVKLHPDRKYELVGRFPASDLEAAKRVGKLRPEDFTDAADRPMLPDYAFSGIQDAAAVSKEGEDGLRAR
ncbi:hypothetical protein [Methylobacterium fujisawaense]